MQAKQMSQQPEQAQSSITVQASEGIRPLLLQQPAAQRAEETPSVASESSSDSAMEREILSTLGQLLAGARNAAHVQSVNSHPVQISADQSSMAVLPEAGELHSL